MTSIPGNSNTAILCLGSNLGNRLSFLEQAADLITKKCGRVTKRSGIYETAAWGSDSDHNYLNQVLQVETALSAPELLKTILTIEHKLGRERTHDRNADRTIDIDILFFNNEISEEKHLTIPHPRLQERRFVLVPLNEIVPDLVHPVFQKSVKYLLRHCNDPLQVHLFAERG
jgi:2-amino-4-hydroxy-6-hydroxymethyldihydropteridine diphosphokinase